MGYEDEFLEYLPPNKFLTDRYQVFSLYPTLSPATSIPFYDRLLNPLSPSTFKFYLISRFKLPSKTLISFVASTKKMGSSRI